MFYQLPRRYNHLSENNGSHHDDEGNGDGTRTADEWNAAGKQQDAGTLHNALCALDSREAQACSEWQKQQPTREVHQEVRE